MNKEKFLIEALKGKALRFNKKGKPYYYVPASVRRNCQKTVSLTAIKKLLKEGKITQEDIDNIMPY